MTETAKQLDLWASDVVARPHQRVPLLIRRPDDVKLAEEFLQGAAKCRGAREV